MRRWSGGPQAAMYATAVLLGTLLLACTPSEEAPQTAQVEPTAGAPPATGEGHVPAAAVPESGAQPAAPPSEPSAAAEPPAAAGGAPVVELQTSKGTIVLQLDAQKAPVSTENFVQYVRSGHYDGTIFHRVIPGFMIQGGGMLPSMDEKPTRDPIVNEAKNGLKNARGTIAMARTNDPNSATAQFFINLVDNTGLDHPRPDGAGYAVFGKVIEGMDVVDAIARVPTGSRGYHQDVPTEPIVIQKATVR
jgi:peptidyl-prolyl cis-trans isomerase A (cyclophilin A)